MATTQREKNDFGAGASHMGEQAKEKFGAAASHMGEQAKEKVAEAGSKAKEMAGDAASYVGKKAEDASSMVGGRMKDLAGTIRDTGAGGVMGAATSRVADTLESGGRYLEEHGLQGIGEDMTTLIRRNPIPAVLVGIGIGFLFARATHRS